MKGKLPMTNDNMRVITSLSAKGGAGKTTLVRAFLSAASANGFRVLAVDTDKNASLASWADLAKNNGVWPDNAICVQEQNSLSIQHLVDDAYEKGTTDIILIDLAGTSLEEHDETVLLSDFVFTPVLLAETDVKISIKVRDWFKLLIERTDIHSSDEPHHVFVPNQVPSNTKFTKSQRHYLDLIRSEFPTTLTEFPIREAFRMMDQYGPLMALVNRLDEKSGQVLQAKQVYDALKISTVILNEVLSGDTYGS